MLAKEVQARNRFIGQQQCFRRDISPSRGSFPRRRSSCERNARGPEPQTCGRLCPTKPGEMIARGGCARKPAEHAPEPPAQISWPGPAEGNRRKLPSD
jgi:hypothetical protein